MKLQDLERRQNTRRKIKVERVVGKGAHFIKKFALQTGQNVRNNDGGYSKWLWG